jgi:hypothetical protein
MVLLKYKQRERKPNILVERWGQKEWQFKSGFIDYDQEEEIDSSEVNERIKGLKSLSNRNYHSFTIAQA